MGRGQCVRAHVTSREHREDKRTTRPDTYLQTFPATWDAHHHQCGARSGSPQLKLLQTLIMNTDKHEHKILTNLIYVISCRISLDSY